MERNNTLPLWIGVVVLVVLIGGFFYFSSAANAEKGTVYVTVSDAAADMGEVTEVTMTVDKVELHSATQGWVTVSDNNEEFDLLALNASGEAHLAARADLEAGTYDQIRATISEVEVETRGRGTQAAVVVARTMTIPGTVVVRTGESSHVDIDVQTSQSLHVATTGEYVFAPVVVYTASHGGEVTVSGRSVTSAGATVDANTAVGTDLAGAIVVGSRLSPDLELSVSGNTVSAADAQGAGSAGGMVQIDTSLLFGGSASGTGTTTSSGSASGTGGGSSSGNASGSATSSVQVQGSGSIEANP